MEEIQNLNVENTVTDVVEVVTDKLTFKENCTAYAIAGVFVTGLVTIGYMGYKGGKKLANKIRNKKEIEVHTDEVVIEVEDNDRDDSNDNDSE